MDHTLYHPCLIPHQNKGLVQGQEYLYLEYLKD
jgi:hypothetical protein